MNEDLTKEMPGPTNAQIFSLLLEMKAQLAGLEQQVSIQKEQIATLTEKVELRHYDTRPIWEVVSREMEQFRVGQEELCVKVEGLRAGQEELHAKVEGVGRDLAAFRAETNHNLKLINHKFKTFLPTSRMSARARELERHFPIVEN